MPRKNTRVVLNRAALDEVSLAVVSGLEAVAAEMTRPGPDVPDAPPFGVGLVNQGGWLSYFNGKKVGGNASRKPRAAKLGKGGVVIAGWGFPARFLEFGTVKMAAEPFVTPRFNRGLAAAEGIMEPIVASKLGRHP